ncbi:MAG: peptide chain release factor 2 [Victivallales bacterium]|nr:peptide chain release factor 2 [Victivallales bacterium]
MTREELASKVAAAQQRVEHLRGYLDVATKREKLDLLQASMNRPDFWDSREKSQPVVDEVSRLKNTLEPFQKVVVQTDDLATLAELAAEEGDNSPLYEEAITAVADLEAALDRLELVSFLSGKMDNKNAIVTLRAGAGGTEACDWVAMLERMYLHWFDRRGFGYVVNDMQLGDEAGIKTMTFTVTGEFAYGYLKGEKGVHRLVRISPFDANKRRHTSFCSVDVVPVIDDTIQIDINEKDLRIDTYHSSGAGGQHINKTSSAVRITHLPTGIVVASQSERSQHQNRFIAMQMLKAKLYQIEEDKRTAAVKQEDADKGDNGWSNQIRSYVLQPYQLVKDLRTGHETSNVQGVLDGDLDPFMNTYLRMGSPTKNAFKDGE